MYRVFKKTLRLWIQSLAASTWALSYYSDRTLSQEFEPMAAQLSMKAALPLAKILAIASCRSCKTGPRRATIEIWVKHETYIFRAVRNRHIDQALNIRVWFAVARPRVISNVDDKWPAYFIVQVNLILANPVLKFCGGSDQPGLTSVIIESIGEQRLTPYQPTCP